MAAFDTVTKRRAILGWGNCAMLPEADSGFDGIDSQLYLGLAGQAVIENGEVPTEPEPEASGGMSTRRKTGIGR